MNYSGISECDVLNGIGFRVVLFVSGCSHKCYNCQNPKTWNKDFGHPFTKQTQQYIFECLSKPYIDGITITGGDPLFENNVNDVLNLINETIVLFPKKTIWMYTGYRYEEIIQTSDIKSDIISKVDVLIDGRYIDSERDLTLRWRGSRNQRVIDIKKSRIHNKNIILFCE